MNPHIGSSFDDFLREEGIFEEVERIAKARAMRRIPAVFGFQLWKGRIKRRVAKKNIRRFHMEWLLNRKTQADFALTVGDFINDCTSYNQRIKTMKPVYVQVGRGAVLIDIDFETESGGACSLAYCGVEPKLSREVIEARVLKHHWEWTFGDPGKRWYGGDTEGYRKAAGKADRMMREIESGGHICNEDGELLDEWRADEVSV